MIKLFQKVRLKTGEEAIIIEILKEAHSFLADVKIGEDEFETDEIRLSDILSIFEEVERPLVA